MTFGEFKERFKDYSDDTKIVLFDDNVGTYNELSEDDVMHEELITTEDGTIFNEFDENDETIVAITIRFPA
jgi:hypothetical protein